VCGFAGAAPAHAHAAVVRQRGIGGVLDQIDHGLLDLVGIGLHRQQRRVGDFHGDVLFETRDAAHQFADLDVALVRRRQARQCGAAGHEARQCLGAIADHGEAAADVLALVRRPLFRTL
jgi:hypothetical protein